MLIFFHTINFQALDGVPNNVAWVLTRSKFDAILTFFPLHDAAKKCSINGGLVISLTSDRLRTFL